MIPDWLRHILDFSGIDLYISNIRALSAVSIVTIQRERTYVHANSFD
jgi:hypothetical protein